MSHFPPFPPNQLPYGERPPFPPNALPPPPRDFPPYYPASSSLPPSQPPISYRPYDNYGSPPRQAYAYEQPRGPYDDHYDPYQPAANAYNPVPPPMRVAPPSYPQQPQSAQAPPPRPPIRMASPPRSAVPNPYPPRQANKPSSAYTDFALLTTPVTVNVHDYTTAVHTLPPSHLPITKYITVNRDDAIDLHRHLSHLDSSIWYADGSSRAGEAWCAAVEWIFSSNRSGSKMRGVIEQGDALESELGGIYKAVEGFKELLQQHIKAATPMSHELVVFCDSQAAIVGIDTSSREEAIKFDTLWREICSDYPHAHMTLVWIPKDSNIEGHVLADKIATVGASNSYLKRRKDKTLASVYMRSGGGDPEPSASTQPGPWQRGDADPTRRKLPFERPKPTPISPLLLHSPPGSSDHIGLDLDLDGPAPSTDMAEGEDEGIQPREGAIFVTHFPLEASAKDIGILFAQYGEIVAVDIFHISPSHPRFANVTFSDPASGLAAIRDLDRKPINLDSPFAISNQADLQIWKNWGGRLTVVRHEPPRVVPASVESDFPDLPDWARGHKDGNRNDEEEKMEVEGQIERERSSSRDESRKRDRESRSEQASGQDGHVASTESSGLGSPSPRKRQRSNTVNGDDTQTHQPVTEAPHAAQAASDIASADPSAHISPITKPDDETAADRRGTPALVDRRSSSAAPSSYLIGEKANLTTATTTKTVLPDPSLASSITQEDASSKSFLQPVPPKLSTNSNNMSTQSPLDVKPVILPPTPMTAEQLSSTVESRLRQPTAEPTSSTSSSKPPITNSAAQPQEYPIKIGGKTLRAHINFVRNSLVKHDMSNWIAHACLIAHDVDHSRRSLQADLYATDECFITGRDLEKTLSTRGYTAAKVDAFTSKVLKVLDGIAAAEEMESEPLATDEDVERMEKELADLLEPYPDQTKEAMASAAKLLEYLIRGKDLQEKKRLEVERRVKVLEGMVKCGDVVSSVVRYLLTEDK